MRKKEGRNKGNRGFVEKVSIQKENDPSMKIRAITLKSFSQLHQVPGVRSDCVGTTGPHELSQGPA